MRLNKFVFTHTSTNLDITTGWPIQDMFVEFLLPQSLAKRLSIFIKKANLAYDIGEIYPQTKTLCKSIDRYIPRIFFQRDDSEDLVQMMNHCAYPSFVTKAPNIVSLWKDASDPLVNILVADHIDLHAKEECRYCHKVKMEGWDDKTREVDVRHFDLYRRLLSFIEQAARADVN